MKIIAIIPARGGSKGIARKNIKLFLGKPLIAYTIIEALKCERIDKVFVSTDDFEIAKTSKVYGADILVRPKELALDETPTIDVIFHVMEQLSDIYDEKTIIVLLQPTSPLRNVGDINRSLDLYIENDCESVISVCKVSHPPFWSFRIRNGYLRPLFGIEKFKMRRQDFEKIYMPNGAIFISTLKTLKKNNNFISNRSIPYYMPVERSMDIDNEMDFKMAEMILKLSNELK